MRKWCPLITGLSLKDRFYSAYSMYNIHIWTVFTYIMEMSWKCPGINNIRISFAIWEKWIESRLLPDIWSCEVRWSFATITYNNTCNAIQFWLLPELQLKAYISKWYSSLTWHEVLNHLLKPNVNSTTFTTFCINHQQRILSVNTCLGKLPRHMARTCTFGIKFVLIYSEIKQILAGLSYETLNRWMVGCDFFPRKYLLHWLTWLTRLYASNITYQYAIKDLTMNSLVRILYTCIILKKYLFIIFKQIFLGNFKQYFERLLHFKNYKASISFNRCEIS